jgi:glycerol-3-phosphate dehydrogenase
MTRATQIEWLRERAQTHPRVPVLIIGGGINGAGVLRDLALQGIDAILVEKRDFASGCSAASTRIIHGGLRYLENGEFRLVRESLLERNRLLRNAPHIVKPLPTTIPIFSWLKGIPHAARKFFGFKSKPDDRGALIIKAGLTLYDAFAAPLRALPTHRMATRAAALRARPALNSHIVATATYYDAWMTNPERLCLEVILDAERAHTGCRAFNDMRAESASGDTVVLHDERTGETFSIQPQIVVNATGAWIDQTNGAMGRDSRYIGGTKGSHLVIDHPDLLAACAGHMLYFANADGRICIFYPVADKVIVGATDIPADDPDSVVCDADETAYLLESVKQVFPSITLTRDHIVFTYCGIRPLPRSDAATTGQISRDHAFPMLKGGERTAFPIYSLIGGKWTTFRAFAEQVTDALLRDLGMNRRTATENIPIGGGAGFPMDESARETWLDRTMHDYEVERERLIVLLERYGTRAVEFLASIADKVEDAPLNALPSYTRGEIAWIATDEYVNHLDDVILRRTTIGVLGQTTRAGLNEIAAICAPIVGWTDETMREEVERTASILAAKHGVGVMP